MSAYSCHMGGHRSEEARDLCEVHYYEDMETAARDMGVSEDEWFHERLKSAERAVAESSGTGISSDLYDLLVMVKERVDDDDIQLLLHKYIHS